jgi:hypothetical protein
MDSETKGVGGMATGTVVEAGTAEAIGIRV